METEIKVLDKRLKISSKLIESGVHFPNSDPNTADTLHNKFEITITNNGVSRKFDFYDSMGNYQKGKKDLTEEGLKTAFRCIISDSLVGRGSFEEFCRELGFDTDSRRAEKMYKECREGLEEIIDLGIKKGELEDIFNELDEDDE